jgi:hypothetical protein
LPVLNTRRNKKYIYFKTHDPPDESIGKRLKKNQSPEYYAVIHGFYLGVPTISSS